MIFSGYSDFSF